MRYAYAEYASAPSLTPHFICPHLEALEHIWTEGVTERHICRIPALGDQDAPDPRHIVARIKGMPATAKVGLEPGGEVHGIRRGRDPDVTEIARAVTRWNIHAATEGNREVGVVAAHAHALIEGFESGLGRPGMLVAEGDMR